MGRRYDNGNGPLLPPRIKAAFDFLDHVRQVTTQMDASVPARDLTPLETGVELAALRALQQYLLGEMDFAETPAPSRPTKRDDDDGTASATAGSTT